MRSLRRTALARTALSGTVLARTAPMPRGRPMMVAAALVALAILAAACGGSDDDTTAGGTTADEAADGGAESTPSDEAEGQSGSGDGDAVSADDLAPDSLGFDGPITVVVPNSPGTLSATGTQRVMTALVGDGPNAFLGGADTPVSVRFDEVEGDQTGLVDGTWLTTNAAALGLYVSAFDFPSAGLWQITVVADGEDLGSSLVEVVEDSTVPNIGDPAPPSETPTGTTPEDLAKISTDPDPDPALYDLTIAEAVDNGKPTVVAFATPQFCQTALCGPTMEVVRAATVGNEEIDVVHVEPFNVELALGEGTLEPIPSMFDWGLVTEPWVFVVDAEGLVTATFEGIIGQAELEAAIAAL